MPAETGLRTGEIVNAAYRLERCVDGDEYQETYLAIRLADETYVLLRMLRAEFALRPGVFEGFVADARTRPAFLGFESDDVGVPFVIEHYDPTPANDADTVAAEPAVVGRLPDHAVSGDESTDPMAFAATVAPGTLRAPSPRSPRGEAGSASDGSPQPSEPAAESGPPPARVVTADALAAAFAAPVHSLRPRSLHDHGGHQAPPDEVAVPVLPGASTGRSLGGFAVVSTAVSPKSLELRDRTVEALVSKTTTAAERSRGRLRFVLWFPVLALLFFATPLLHEPDLGSARALLGPAVKVAATAFLVTSTIAVFAAWGATALVPGRVFRVTVTVFTAAVALAATRAGTLWIPLGPLDGFARAGLPWAMGGFFGLLFVLALSGGLRGLARNPAAGVVMLLGAVLSLGAAHQLLSVTVLEGGGERLLAVRRVMALLAEEPPPEPETLERLVERAAEEPEEEPGVVKRIKRLARPSLEDGTVKGAERAEVGASEAQDMKTIDELRDNRRGNQARLGKLERLLGDATGQDEAP